MVGVARIEGSLKESGLSLERVIAILESDSSDDAQTFLAKWNDISVSDRKYLKIDEICVAAGLTTRRLWEVISGARFSQAQDVIKLMVAEAQPDVVRATIRAATHEFPIFDRHGNLVGHQSPDVKAMELLYRATGFVPTPKGSTTTINLNPGSQLPAEVSSEDDDDDGLLPDMDDLLKDIQTSLAAPIKQLEAPKVVEAEFEELR
jgi:hypothetical protein